MAAAASAWLLTQLLHSALGPRKLDKSVLLQPQMIEVGLAVMTVLLGTFKAQKPGAPGRRATLPAEGPLSRHASSEGCPWNLQASCARRVRARRAVGLALSVAAGSLVFQRWGVLQAPSSVMRMVDAQKARAAPDGDAWHPALQWLLLGYRAARAAHVLVCCMVGTGVLPGSDSHLSAAAQGAWLLASLLAVVALPQVRHASKGGRVLRGAPAAPLGWRIALPSRCALRLVGHSAVSDLHDVAPGPQRAWWAAVVCVVPLQAMLMHLALTQHALLLMARHVDGKQKAEGAGQRSAQPITSAADVGYCVVRAALRKDPELRTIGGVVLVGPGRALALEEQADQAGAHAAAAALTGLLGVRRVPGGWVRRSCSSCLTATRRSATRARWACGSWTPCWPHASRASPKVSAPRTRSGCAPGTGAGLRSARLALGVRSLRAVAGFAWRRRPCVLSRSHTRREQGARRMRARARARR